MTNPKIEVKAYAQSHYPRKGDKIMGYTIRTKQYRYVAWYQESFRTKKILATTNPVAIELYDYKKDALETVNLATKAEYNTILKEHEKLMTEFLNNQKQSRL